MASSEIQCHVVNYTLHEIVFSDNRAKSGADAAWNIARKYTPYGVYSLV